MATVRCIYTRGDIAMSVSLNTSRIHHLRCFHTCGCLCVMYAKTILQAGSHLRSRSEKGACLGPGCHWERERANEREMGRERAREREKKKERERERKRSSMRACVRVERDTCTPSCHVSWTCIWSWILAYMCMCVCTCVRTEQYDMCVALRIELNLACTSCSISAHTSSRSCCRDSARDSSSSDSAAHINVCFTFCTINSIRQNLYFAQIYVKTCTLHKYSCERGRVVHLPSKIWIPRSERVEL